MHTASTLCHLSIFQKSLLDFRTLLLLFLDTVTAKFLSHLKHGNVLGGIHWFFSVITAAAAAALAGTGDAKQHRQED